ncbi:MAG: flavodoxin family protein [Deltaproteobacteria bacterium]|nr:MAG: flavodoxin family protein [Deltaproteobacteria bacterium]
MEHLTINILGVSGAHRKARNSSFMVQEALRSAEKVKGVETQFIELADFKIEYCRHCNKCIFSHDDTNRKHGGNCIIKDDMQKIYPLLEEADGIIFGSPVYVSNVSGRMKTFMDRLRPLAFKGTFGFKVGGAVSVALLAFGGQEVTNNIILGAFHILEGITVSGMATGGAGYSGPPLGPRGADDDGKNIAVKDDPYAMTSAMMVGRKVAETAKVIKYGIHALGAEFNDLCSVYHFPLKPEEWKRWNINLI